MRLNKIDFSHVQADIDTGIPVQYNTSFHTLEEAPDLEVPLETPYSFDRWLPLILHTRGLEQSAVQTVHLSRVHGRLLIQACMASIHTRKLNQALAEDLDDELRHSFSALQYPSGGLFMRFAACSPKDGVWSHAPLASVCSFEDILLQITTSMRAWQALVRFIDESDDETLALYFVPYNARMRTDMEYRVFCAPATLEITAVSQYKWHKPWRFSDKGHENMEVVAERILRGAKGIHGMILAGLQPTKLDALDDLLRKQGFSFDVWYDDESDRVDLVELNTYGARSGCGACLFQWIRDRDVLYGTGGGDIEFRVAVCGEPDGSA